MSKFISKPYKLYNKIQHYEWGARNSEAFIPHFLGINPIENLPYAELWIGAHPKAPSEIEMDGKLFPLNLVIEKHTIEFLGEHVTKKFNGKFPFLLKILSADQALSIQTHPDKLNAVKLHAADPVNYPDENHKPEIAIAIDSLEAVAGFRPAEEIINNLIAFPELVKLVDHQPAEKIIDESELKKNIFIKEFYSALMKLSEDKEKISACISGIVGRLTAKSHLENEEKVFVDQHKIYGNDVGLLSLFFFNLIQLRPGQAIFTGAGVPHAYLKGNIVECMANSDNVVRAGLTNKYKDVKTLLEIIRFDFQKYPVLNRDELKNEMIYKTPAEEFEVAAYIKKTDFEKTFRSNYKPIVFLLMEGTLIVSWCSKFKEENIIFTKGEAIIIPASLSDFKIKSISNSAFFTVTIP